jgi:hypothetical protein
LQLDLWVSIFLIKKEKKKKKKKVLNMAWPMVGEKSGKTGFQVGERERGKGRRKER